MSNTAPTGATPVTSASLAGANATEVSLQIPAWGIPYADVTLDKAVTLSGKVTLVVADLTAQCTVLSGGPTGDAGRSYFRVAAGAGGWGQVLPAKAYSNDAGVKLSTVLADLATATGETIDQTTVDQTVRLGPYWTRPNDTAARVLELVAPSNWYVGTDGVTRLGQRAASTLNTKYVTTSEVDLARGMLTLSGTTVAGIMPGLAVGGLTAVDVEHEWSTAGLRSRIWGNLSTGTSRRLSALRAIMNQLFPRLKFQGVWEYRIVSQTGARLNLQPVQVSTGMPSLLNVKVRPGVAGCKATYALGSYCLVEFVNSDPARPVVTGFDDAEAGGFVPTALMLAGGGAAVGRVGDSTAIKNVTIAAPSGGGTCTISINGAPPVPISGINLDGVITSGSGIVSSG